MPASKMKQVWLPRAIVLLTSVAITFGVLEFLARRKVPRPFVTIAQTSTIEGLSYELRPGYSGIYFGDRVEINKHGFRGPEVCDKANGVRRIALIGDSNTFGHVPYENTISVQLAEKLRNRGEELEVFNCGVPGYDAANVAASLESKVLKLQPDVVIYLFCHNDAPVPDATAKMKIAPDHIVDPYASFPLRSAYLEWSGRTVNTLLRQFGKPRTKGYVAGVLQNWNNGGMERLRACLEKMRDLCESHNIRFLIANTPSMASAKVNPYADIEKGLQAACDSLGITFVDLVSAFPPNDTMQSFQVSWFDGHPNGKANELMADVLVTVLQSEDE